MKTARLTNKRNKKRSGERERERWWNGNQRQREWVLLNECKVLMKDKLMSETGAFRASCSPATTCDPACHSHSIAMTIIVHWRLEAGQACPCNKQNPFTIWYQQTQRRSLSQSSDAGVTQRKALAHWRKFHMNSVFIVTLISSCPNVPFSKTLYFKKITF